MRASDDRSWKLALTGGGLLMLAYLLVPMPLAARYSIFVVSQVNAVLATVVGVRRHRPSVPAPWVGFGSSVAIGLVAAVVYGVQTVTAGDWTYPTPADLLFLAMFPPLIVALLAVIRARSVGNASDDAAALVDAAITTLAVGVLAVPLLLPEQALALQPLRLVQPLLDVLVLGLVIRVALGGGEPRPSLLFGAAAVIGLVTADLVELAVRLQGGAPPPLVTSALLAASVLWSASALHPSMATITHASQDPNRGALSWWRFALLAAAALLVPAMQATQPVHGHDLPDAWLGWAATALVVLVVTRVGLLIRDQRVASKLRSELQRRQSEARLGVLVQHSSDVVVLVDGENRVTYATPSLRRLLGYNPEGTLGQPLPDLVGESGNEVRRQLDRLAALRPGSTVPLEEDVEIAHRDGTPRRLEVIATNLLQHPDVGAMVLTGRDVTAQRRLEEQLRRQALTDPLTGLANRTLFTDRVAHTLTSRRRHPESQVAILFIDLDDFKTINDSLGHDTGDELLIAVADRLRGCARLEDTVARLGGDEFAVLLTDLDVLEAAEEVADRVLASLADPVLVGGRHVRPSASIGIAATTADTYPTADELLRNADTAMYTVKHGGKAGRTRFAAAMHDQAMRRLDLVSDLERALDQGQFTLQYQPIVDLPGDGRIAGAEALVRWEHPEHGRIPPGEFIALAEETGAIIPLGRWVLQQACRQLADWRHHPRAGSPLTIAVNVSAHQLRHDGLIDDVAAALADAGLPPDALTLELTESALIADADAAAATLQELRQLGVRIAVDDFGTGYSSLSYLGQFPIDSIKIDKSFVDQLAGDDSHEGLTRGVLSLAATLTVSTIAEGIETSDQLRQLLDLNCPYGQGYLFDRPLDPETFARRLVAPLPLAATV